MKESINPSHSDSSDNNTKELCRYPNSDKSDKTDKKDIQVFNNSQLNQEKLGQSDTPSSSSVDVAVENTENKLLNTGKKFS